VIYLEDIKKTYGKNAKPALKDLTINIEKGEFVFLVGPSGSGKSTLIRLVLREEKQDSGLIQVAGRDLSTIPTRHIPVYRRKLGVVFQDFRLLENKTVYENVSFALEVIGTPRHTINSLVPDALQTVGLKGKETRMPNELSGGEQQRVAIARAFVNRPLIILADEPTGNLDPVTSLDVVQVFESINEKGTTILMATHNDEIVNSLQKRVIELSEGDLVRDEEKGKYSVRVKEQQGENV
jgi:cell division transport system ATP-binding protein